MFIPVPGNDEKNKTPPQTDNSSNNQTDDAEVIFQYVLECLDRGESPDELLGYVDAVRTRAVPFAPKTDGLLDVGSPYDGRAKHVVALHPFRVNHERIDLRTVGLNIEVSAGTQAGGGRNEGKNRQCG